MNLSPFESRDVMVQAGTYGEHSFSAVKYRRMVNDRAQDQSLPVNAKCVQVTL